MNMVPGPNPRKTDVDDSQYKKYYPCRIDGKSFNSIFFAWQYLMEVNGRIQIDHLARFLRRGKKMIYCHHIGTEGENDGLPCPTA